MKLTPHVIDAMLAAGCTAEQIAAAVKAAMHQDDESQADRRERDRIRKREQRAREKGNENNNRVHDVTRTDADGADNLPPLSPPDKDTPTPPEINPPYIPPSGVSLRGASAGEFADFWAIYPNKVGKRDAEKAFAKARQRADLETILAGLRRYAAKTDDRPWCNPATWLNQDRWDDAPAAAPPRQATSPPPGRRMNAVEAYASLKSEQDHEPASRTIDHRDDEQFSPNQPRLQALAGELGQAMRWPGGSGNH